MAKRTDRQKVKYRAQAMMDHMQAALGHAHELDMVNNGQSPFINEKLPVVVTGIQLACDLIEKFRDRL
jgi:hypothetical protein